VAIFAGNIDIEVTDASGLADAYVADPEKVSQVLAAGIAAGLDGVDADMIKILSVGAARRLAAAAARKLAEEGVVVVEYEVKMSSTVVEEKGITADTFVASSGGLTTAIDDALLGEESTLGIRVVSVSVAEPSVQIVPSFTQTSTSITNSATSTVATLVGAQIIVSGSAVFTAEAVTSAQVQQSVRSALVDSFAVSSDSLVINIAEARRLQNSAAALRQLASTWVATYEAALDPVPAVDLIIRLNVAAASPASFSSMLTSLLTAAGADASTIALTLLSSPQYTQSVAVNGTACGVDVCSTTLARSVAPADLCELALTCSDADSLCCEPPTLDPSNGDDTSAASTRTLLGALGAAILGPLVCLIAFVLIRRFCKSHSKIPLNQQQSQDFPKQELFSFAGPGSPVNAPASLRVHASPTQSPVVSPTGVSLKELDSPGAYVLTSAASVKRNLAPDSDEIGRLTGGSEVEVIEIVDLGPTHNRVVARISEPSGWIPLRDTRSGQRFAQKVIGGAEGGSPKSSVGVNFASPTYSTTTKQDRQVRAQLDALQGEWRVYEGGKGSSSVMVIGANGAATSDGVRVREQDLVIADGMISRRDGWMVNMESSSEQELLWSKPGEASIIWKRVKPGSEYAIGDMVQWTHETKDVPSGTKGEVVGLTGSRVRVKFPNLTVDALPSELLPVEMVKREEQVQALLEALQGEWRLYEGTTLFPGIVAIGGGGYALYDGMHWPEQDLIVLGDTIARGDGWAVDMSASNEQELLWCKPGETSISWKRVKAVSDYRIGEIVEWTLETHDVPRGTKGEVVGLTDSRVRVKFPKLTFDVLPGEILADENYIPATPASGTQEPVVERTVKDALASIAFEGSGDAPSTPQSRLSQQSQQKQQHQQQQQQQESLQEEQLEDEPIEQASSSSNLASKRPPPLEVDVEQGPPAVVPASVTPWSGSGSSPGGPPSPGQTGMKVSLDGGPVSGSTPTSMAGNITVYPPGSPQQPVTITQVTPSGTAAAAAAAPPAAPPASSSSAPAEMMMVYPPGAEHPVLYQQVGTPVHTPTSPPSTMTPPGSPNVVQSSGAAAAAAAFPASPAFSARPSSGKPGQPSGPPASGGQSSPSDGTRSRSAPGSPAQWVPPEAPPGAQEVHTTASGRTWWGANMFKAVTGPIGSGMSEISGKFRRKEGSAMPSGGSSAKPLDGTDGMDLPPSPGLGNSGERAPHSPSSASPRGGTLLERDTDGIVAEFGKDEAERSEPPTPAAPVVQRSPRADRRQILV